MDVGALQAGLLFAPRGTRVIASTLAGVTISDFLQIAYKAAEDRGPGGSWAGRATTRLVAPARDGHWFHLSAVTFRWRSLLARTLVTSWGVEESIFWADVSAISRALRRADQALRNRRRSALSNRLRPAGTRSAPGYTAQDD